MMRVKYLLIAVGLFVFGILGYSLGKQSDFKILLKEETWQKMDSDFSGSLLQSALKYGEWQRISKEDARSTLPAHIDASDVPHGDMAVPSEKVHSKRYLISQWQRVATGAVTVVLGRDMTGSLYTALGVQRGKIVIPQGYMESHLPSEDLTGLKEKGASRVNGSTGELVYADNTLEDNAVREVKEELGIDISKDNLELLSISSAKDANPIVHTVAGLYGIVLPNTPKLKTLDTEFVNDDMQDPFWVRIQDIKCIKDTCHVPNNTLSLRNDSVLAIQEAIRKLGSDTDKKAYQQFLSFKQS